MRVVVTGIGLVTPLGNDKETFFNSLVEKRSGIMRTQYGLAATVDMVTESDRTVEFAIKASLDAIADAGIKPEGVYLGTGMGSSHSIEEGYTRLFNGQRLRPLTVIDSMNNAAASQISIAFGLIGSNQTFCNACASSGIAIGEAYRLIKDNYADCMLAGGAEALLTRGTMIAWEALRITASETPDIFDSCRPFSKSRTGLVLGEGSAMLILESMESAIERKAHIYGEIIGYATTNDTHITTPTIDGMARAMRQSLIGIDRIDYINAHGTGTILNDATESEAINEVFHITPPVSSTKALHGHLMGAAGAVEFVACLLAMEKQILPPTAFLVDPIPNLDYIPEARAAEINTVMSNSFAFGGASAVLIATR